MAGRILRIAGQVPRVKWKRNRGRKKRTIDEAVLLAKQNGVEIPESVEFVEAERGELAGGLKDLFAGGEMETARGPSIAEHRDGYVYWQNHFNVFGKIRFKVHPEILQGDECIVAVFQHEMHELRELHDLFLSNNRRRVNAADYGWQVAPGHGDNFHDEAREAADQAVLRMRKAER
jgi:hypothetical protein